MLYALVTFIVLLLAIALALILWPITIGLSLLLVIGIVALLVVGFWVQLHIYVYIIGSLLLLDFITRRLGRKWPIFNRIFFITGPKEKY